MPGIAPVPIYLVLLRRLSPTPHPITLLPITIYTFDLRLSPRLLSYFRSLVPDYSGAAASLAK